MKMSNEELNRMIELQTMIDTAKAELEELKDKMKDLYNGEGGTESTDKGSVTISKPGRNSEVEKWDMVRFKIEAPATYDKLHKKYCAVTVKAGRAAAVTVKPNK